MWKCLDCGREIDIVNTDDGLTCPYCGSKDVTEMSGEIPYSYQVSSVTTPREDDQVIVRSLLRCGVDYPTIFNLVWGEKMIDNEEFPLELRTVIANIYYREKGERRVS